MKLLFSLVLIQKLFLIYVESKDLQVEMITVVFRHGDRTPDPNTESFPTDRYKNYDYYPLTRGELTNNGKRREYKLGIELRKVYNEFLGKYYHSPDLFSRSTHYRRTKMSLQLVLAGLYPPQKPLIWNRNLNWQPIATDYVPGQYDSLLIPEECPEYMAELARVRELPDVKAEVSKFAPLMANLTKFTGKLVKNSRDMYFLYHGLSSQKAMGFDLPAWTKGIFPKGPLLDAVLLEYQILHYNEKLRRLNGGKIVRFIAERMRNMTEDLGEVSKVQVLSGHETNVAALLYALNATNYLQSDVPQYSSAVIVELLQDSADDNYYVRVRFYRGIPEQFDILTIPGCEEICPIRAFRRLIKNVIPTPAELICVKSNTLDQSEIDR